MTPLGHQASSVFRFAEEGHHRRFVVWRLTNGTSGRPSDADKVAGGIAEMSDRYSAALVALWRQHDFGPELLGLGKGLVHVHTPT